MLLSRRKSLKFILITFILFLLYFFYKIFFLKFNLEFFGYNKIGSIADLKENNIFFINKEKIIIKENNLYLMINLVCPHQGCIVQFSNENMNFVCPCHDSVFDFNGSYILGPSRKSLKKTILFSFNGDLYN